MKPQPRLNGMLLNNLKEEVILISQIGRRIYYEKLTGNIILDTGEREGYVVECTVEQDFQIYKALSDSERNLETVGIIQLEYGQYAQDFMECNGYRINPDTSEIEFSYPDPNQSLPQEPVYRKPLSEEVADLKQSIAELTIILGGMPQ